MSDGDRQQVASLDLKNLNVISALGRGAKGVVFLVRSGGDESFALKAILRSSVDKSITASNKIKRSSNDSNESHNPTNGHDNDDAIDHRTSSSEYRRICFEQDVLASLNHPLFPKLRGLLTTNKIIGYAIDYCPGRDLNSLRKKQTEKMFSDDIIRFYAAEIVLALEYLHGMGIVYRDLKPENVMIQENGHLMLVDFDLSTKLYPKTPETRRFADSSPEDNSRNKKKPRTFLSMFCNSGIMTESDSVHPVELSSESSVSQHSDSVEKSNSFVGTEEYVAPEIIEGKGHDFSVDWWCLGILLHEMLYGTTPFRGSNRKETFYRILVKTPELVGEPTPLRELIRKLLEKDPKKRITLEEIKGHEFFKHVEWDHVLEIPRPPFIPTVEDIEGNKQIDVESFVQGVFKVGEDDEKIENNNKKKNKGVWVEELNNPHIENDNFLIF